MWFSVLPKTNVSYLILVLLYELDFQNGSIEIFSRDQCLTNKQN